MTLHSVGCLRHESRAPITLQLKLGVRAPSSSSIMVLSSSSFPLKISSHSLISGHKHAAVCVCVCVMRSLERLMSMPGLAPVVIVTFLLLPLWWCGGDGGWFCWKPLLSAPSHPKCSNSSGAISSAHREKGHMLHYFKVNFRPNIYRGKDGGGGSEGGVGGG